jgi:ribonucleotide monophosphatase NagD (HAD superfamily)
MCIGNKFYDDQDTPTQLYGLQITNCDGGLVANNTLKNNVTSNEIYTAVISGIHWGVNIEGSEASIKNVNIKLQTILDILNITIEGMGDTADVINIVNNKTSATAIGIIGNKDTIQFYHTNSDFMWLRCRGLKVNNGSITNASTPANFSADKKIIIYDADGTPYYIPAKAAAW